MIPSLSLSLLQRIFSSPGKSPGVSLDLTTDMAIGGFSHWHPHCGRTRTQNSSQENRTENSSAPAAHLSWIGQLPTQPSASSTQILAGPAGGGVETQQKAREEGALITSQSPWGMREGLPEYPSPQFTSTVGSMHTPQVIHFPGQIFCFIKGLPIPNFSNSCMQVRGRVRDGGGVL